MGRSFTYHVVGECQARQGETVGALVGAMSRLEAHQAGERARRDGTPVTAWYSQTRTGLRILGITSEDQEPVPHDRLPRVSTVQCPRCSGRGCQVCRWAGFTSAAHLAGFRAWQLAPEEGATP